MELIYNLSMYAVLAVLVLGTIGVMRPQLFSRIIGGSVSHRRMFVGSFVALLVFGSSLVFSEPDTVKQARLGQHVGANIASADGRVMGEQTDEGISKVTETATEAIPFTEQTYTDNKLAKGQSKVKQAGVNGEKTLVYEVTYTNGVETGRILIREEIIKEAVPKRIAIGSAAAKSTNTKKKTQTKPKPTETCADGESSVASESRRSRGCSN